MRKLILAISVVAATLPLRADQPVVRVEPNNLQGPRILNDQTKSTVIRNYLEAWQSVSAALQQNRADLLDRDFVGTAKDKLIDTIHDQVTMGKLQTIQKARGRYVVVMTPAEVRWRVRVFQGGPE
jgi:hypothetical protein